MHLPLGQVHKSCMLKLACKYIAHAATPGNHHQPVVQNVPTTAKTVLVPTTAQTVLALTLHYQLMTSQIRCHTAQGNKDTCPYLRDWQTLEWECNLWQPHAPDSLENAYKLAINHEVHCKPEATVHCPPFVTYPETRPLQTANLSSSDNLATPNTVH